MKFIILKFLLLIYLYHNPLFANSVFYENLPNTIYINLELNDYNSM